MTTREFLASLFGLAAAPAIKADAATGCDVCGAKPSSPIRDVYEGDPRGNWRTFSMGKPVWLCDQHKRPPLEFRRDGGIVRQGGLPQPGDPYSGEPVAQSWKLTSRVVDGKPVWLIEVTY